MPAAGDRPERAQQQIAALGVMRAAGGMWLIGVQIAARPFEDEVVLGVARVVDAAFGFKAPARAIDR